MKGFSAVLVGCSAGEVEMSQRLFTAVFSSFLCFASGAKKDIPVIFFILNRQDSHQIFSSSVNGKV
jgi:hypothetical protein